MAILNRENDDSSVENRNTIRFQIHPILPNSSFCCVSVELWQRGPLQDVVWKQSFPHPWTVCLAGFNAPHWILPAVCLLNSKGTLLNGSIIVLLSFCGIDSGTDTSTIKPKEHRSHWLLLSVYICLHLLIYLSFCLSVHPSYLIWLSIHPHKYVQYTYIYIY